MSRPAAPFVWIDGRPYLDVGYELEPIGTPPSLHALLKSLLVHNDPCDILLLRPLSRAEARLLWQSTEGAEVEAWAQIAATRADRFRPRHEARRRRSTRRRRPKAQRARAGR